MAVKYDRLILIMDDTELEQFCREWVERKKGYYEVRRYGGAGDKGRDVVGFLTKDRHEGEWDNYQCKQYRTKLGVADGLLAVGKVLYWASVKEFTAPRKFFFVAPKGLNGKLASLVDKPAAFKARLISDWQSACASKIIDNQVIPLNDDLRAVIDMFSFSDIEPITIDEMMADSAVVPLLVEKFGADPGQYPPASIPLAVQDAELKYITALIEAYGERDNIAFKTYDEVFAHPTHGNDLKDHRERYFEADAFQKFYRDNTPATTIPTFKRDIRLGVQDKLKTPGIDSLGRVEAVMTQAASVTPGGPLAKYAFVAVKQGVCHHLVDEGVLSWKAPT